MYIFFLKKHPCWKRFLMFLNNIYKTLETRSDYECMKNMIFRNWLRNRKNWVFLWCGAGARIELWLSYTFSNKNLFRLILDLQARQCIHITITKMVYRNKLMIISKKAEKIIHKPWNGVISMKSNNLSTGQTSDRIRQS